MSTKRDAIGNGEENGTRTVEVVPLTTTVEIADVIVVANAPSLEVSDDVSVDSGGGVREGQ